MTERNDSGESALPAKPPQKPAIPPPPQKPATQPAQSRTLISRVRSIWRQVTHNRGAKWIFRYIGVASTLFTTVEGLQEALDWTATAPRLVLFAALLGLPIAVTLAIFHGHLRREHISPAETILLILLCVGAAFGMQQMYRHLRIEGIAAAPDVVLQFVNPTDPGLVFENPSDALVREVSWVALLFDLDSTDPAKMIEFRPAPLDWLPAHGYSFPLQLKSSLLADPPLKVGDRVYGSVVVGCPTCGRAHTYLLALQWGVSGWSAEITSLRNGQYAHPPAFTAEGLLHFAQAINAAVPPSRRVPLVAFGAP